MTDLMKQHIASRVAILDHVGIPDGGDEFAAIIDFTDYDWEVIDNNLFYTSTCDTCVVRVELFRESVYRGESFAVAYTIDSYYYVFDCSRESKSC